MKFAVVDVGNTSTAVGLWSDGRVTCVSHWDGGFAEASEAVRKTVRANSLGMRIVEGDRRLAVGGSRPATCWLET